MLSAHLLWAFRSWTVSVNLPGDEGVLGGWWSHAALFLPLLLSQAPQHKFSPSLPSCLPGGKKIVNKYPVVPKGEAKHGIGHWMLLYFISLMSEKLTSQVSLGGATACSPEEELRFHQEPQDCCRSERLTVTRLVKVGRMRRGSVGQLAYSPL